MESAKVKNLALAAVLAVSTMATAAQAATVTVSSFVGDVPFNNICALGTSNNQECENVVGEIRGGGGGTYEQSLNTPTQFGAVTDDFSWTKEQKEAFTLSHATNGLMSLTLAGQTITMPNPTGAYDGLTGANAMFIRIRNNSAAQTLSLSDMMLNGMSIGGIASGDLLDDGNTVGSGSNGAGYLRIDGFDFGQAWSLTGDVALDWAGANVPNRSRLNANFKVATLPTAPIPLPAAGWMLLAGFGGLALLRRRTRA